jgi:hypothetical protein
MKLFFLLTVCAFILEGCGKKNDPKYQVKIMYEIKVIS